MLFSKWITIPVDRSVTNPYTESIKISKGVVRKVFVLIPVPSAWCVGVSIWYASWQAFPTSRTEWFVGGMVNIEFEEDLTIDDVPLSFTIKCYNEDTVNTHKVWVAFSIVRPTVSSQMQEFLKLFEE